MMQRFTGQVAIVTGGVSGIGLAIARRLAAEGARLVLADVDEQRGAAAVHELEQGGALAPLFARCDVGDEAQVQACVTLTLERCGGLDVVVNNAGLMQFHSLVELSTEDWLRTLRVDLFGAVHFLRQAILHARPGGAVVNIASIHAIETEALVAPYAAAKAALLSLTRSAALECDRSRLRINAVLPGAVDTPMLWNNPHVRSGVEVIRDQDVGTPEDIAAAVAFLASREAAFVHGTALTVDGGRLARL